MNTETKQHIDAARQVLVGVVPNPTSQIDQITNALIYKFMDDMDQSAIKQGGDPSFFIGDLKDYAWTRLMDARIGNQQRMNIYSEALVKFSESKQLPQLFREIFKSAFLPYRSPEVLGLFLKEIDYFDYSHPEELGNAYEYLLSIMSSQGDAGQFRTPRHIIDFIVDVVNPTAEDKVLDPACGTGGFLVSAYKHILEQHDGKNSDGTKNNEKPLTPDQRKNLMGNFEGYDIDPGMVRIAQVNMYLHQFKNPKIFNYDTLSMEERWGDKFSVILANPPFMSPKGGVSTHNKFSIQSTRSEVLFVDYIMNHLRPQGRAGIIVPEGIIFQSGTSHKQLRKNLVEDGLYAVVSLPSGVFQPYSGVKTSILFFNQELAKRSKEILFVKIENDGFDLGASKRAINKNDLPESLDILNKWKNGRKLESNKAVYVEKAKIAESGDYNLSGDRYRIATDYTNAKWPIVELGEVFETTSGGTPSKSKEEFYKNGTIPWLKSGEVGQGFVYKSEEKITETGLKNSSAKMFPVDTVLVAMYGATTGKVGLLKFESSTNQAICGILPNDKFIPEFLYFYLRTQTQEMIRLSGGGAQPNISQNIIRKLKIPFPPIEIQRQIVTELESYQNLINGAKQIINNWKPIIDIKPEYAKVKIGTICDPEYGFTDTAKERGDARYIRITDISSSGELITTGAKYINLTDESKKYLLSKGDLLLARTGATFGKTLLFNHINEPCVFASFLIRLRFPKEKVLPKYYWAFSQSALYWEQANKLVTGGGQPQFNGGAIKQIEIPIPPLEIQKQIAEKIEAEHILIEGNKKLIEIYEQRTKDTLAMLWEK